MAELQDPVLTVRLPELGLEWSRFTSYELDSDYFTSTDGFSFTLYSENQASIAGWELQPVELSIDGAEQLLGRIDMSEIGDNSAIAYHGRDYIADLVECNVDPSVVIKEGEKLFDAITRVASVVGIDTVLDDHDVNLRDVRSGHRVGAVPFTRFGVMKARDYKPSPGQGIYEFLNRIVARIGATMQPGLTRNQLVLSAPNYEQPASFSIRVTRDTNSSVANNTYNCKAKRDYSKMPTYGLFQGRGAKPGKAHDKLSREFSVPVLASALSNAFFNETGDQLIRYASNNRRKPAPNAIFPSNLYRLLFFKDNDARDEDMVARALRRAVSDRIRDTLVYTCTKRGHRDPETGVVYSVDTCARVDDDIRRVHEDMWVVARKFRYGEGGGAETDLTLLRKGVIQL